MRSIPFILAVPAAILACGILQPQTRVAAAENPPAVAGEWTGTWGVYSPTESGRKEPGKEPGKAPQYPQMRLDCKVAALSDGRWQATFEGECGRPYKYTVKMLGRQVGSVVLFQGTADLGEQDGGVYDWIGRATENEFVGFYTSKKYTGTFQLARPKRPAPAAGG